MLRRPIRALVVAALAVAGGPAEEAAAVTSAFDAASLATFTLQGPPASGTGTAVALLGDVNGDGRADVGASAPFADLPGRPDAGIVRVVFGSPATRGTADLAAADVPGFRIVGGRYYRAGFGLAAAGDINGDGLGDVLLSAPRHGVAGYKSPGHAYVVFGTTGQATVDLTRLRRSQGFPIVGVEPWGSASPDSVAGVGDIDRDGLGDIVVSEAVYRRNGRRHRGDVVVVYGSRRPAGVDLARLGSGGFRLTGARRIALAGAGDANGDRRADLLLGAPSVKLPGRRFPVNSVFVVFGRRHRGTIDLRRLGARGYRIGGLVAGTIHRASVAGVGDVDRDGRADALLVRHPGGSVGRRPEATLVFGSRSTRTVDARRPGGRGFRILGESAAGRFSGLGPVAALGDVNADGLPDLGLGSFNGAGQSSYEHSAFIVFGTASRATVELDDLGPGGLRLTGPSATGTCGARGVGAALAAGGDLDADGRADVLVGAPALGACAGQALLVPLP